MRSTEIAENEVEEETEEFQINNNDLVKFILVMSCAVVAQKWIAGSQIFPILSVKFGWTTEKQEERGLSLLMAVAISVGVVFYAISGKLMQKGRRKLLIWGSIITTFGNGLMCFGRFPIHLTEDCFYAAG